MRLKLNIAFFLLSIFSLPLFSDDDIPEPYCSTIDLPFDNHGWFNNAAQIKPLLQDKKIVIEIGSWLGCSTRFIASNTSEDALIYAVDTWKGSSQENEHAQDPRLPHLYQLFLSNVKHANLTRKIIPMRMDSIEASKALNIKADLIYIDGAHDTQSVINDILAWFPHLNEGGVMCGDDWQGWDSVKEAVIYSASILNKTIHSDTNFWWYE